MWRKCLLKGAHMQLVVAFNEVMDAVRKHLDEQGFDYDPKTLHVEYDHEGQYDDQRVVGFKFVVDLKKKGAKE